MILFLISITTLFTLAVYLCYDNNRKPKRVLNRKFNRIYYKPQHGPEQEYCKYVNESIKNKYISLDSEDISYTKNNDIILINWAEFSLDKNTNVIFDYTIINKKTIHYIEISYHSQ